MGCFGSRPVGAAVACVIRKDGNMVSNNNIIPVGTGIHIDSDNGPVEVFLKIDIDGKNQVQGGHLGEALKATKWAEKKFIKSIITNLEANPSDYITAEELFHKLRHASSLFHRPDSNMEHADEWKTFHPLEVFVVLHRTPSYDVCAYEFKTALKLTEFPKKFPERTWGRYWQILIWKALKETSESPTKKELKSLNITNKKLKTLSLKISYVFEWYRCLTDFLEVIVELENSVRKARKPSAFALEYDSDDDEATNSIIMKAVNGSLMHGKDKTDFEKIWNTYDVNKDQILDRSEILKLLNDLMFGVRDHVHKSKLAWDTTGRWNKEQHILHTKVENIRRDIMSDPQGLIKSFLSKFQVFDKASLTKEHMWKKRKSFPRFMKDMLKEFKSLLSANIRLSKKSKPKRQAKARVPGKKEASENESDRKRGERDAAETEEIPDQGEGRILLT
ncbi:hypothetical protein AAMO2058_000548800 [Amorphochlora amoebiformis]